MRGESEQRGSTKKGVPHLIASSASGATLVRIRVQPAQMRLALAWGSPDMFGDVVGRLLAISFASITDACLTFRRSAEAFARNFLTPGRIRVGAVLPGR